MPPSHDRSENDQNVHLGADRVNQDWHLNCNRSLPSQSSHKCICSRLFQLQKYPALGGYNCRWVIIPEEEGSLSIWDASDVGQGWFLMRNRAMAIVEFVYPMILWYCSLSKLVNTHGEFTLLASGEGRGAGDGQDGQQGNGRQLHRGRTGGGGGG